MKQATFVELVEKNFALNGKLLQAEMKSMSLVLQDSSFMKQYRILYAFYLMAKGRSYSPEVIKRFVIALCMFVWSHFSSQLRLKKFFAEFIDSTIEEDAQLPSIQRFFPEYFARMKPNLQVKSYVGNTEALFAGYTKFSAFTGISSLLSLYAGVKEEDLFELLIELGELVRLRDFALAFRATTKSLAAGNTRDIDRTAVAVIAKNVADVHLLATFENFSVNFDNFQSSDAKNLFALAKRYDVLTVIEKNIMTKLSATQRVIHEVSDVFTDFQQSIVRKKFQKIFVNRITKFLHI